MERSLRNRREPITPHLALDILICSTCVVSIAGVLVRPFGFGEWAWAAGGALLLTAFGLVPLHRAASAIAAGTDVYLFLVGMMLLSELARRQGVFDWAARHAVRASRGSATRLFAIVYAVGAAVTVVLSNDATAVVLTPAVAAAVRAAKAPPLPYLFACALVANAASFVLPISNPANLVVFAGAMPTLPNWLAAFALPSIAAIGVTFVVLRGVFRSSLRDAVSSEGRPQVLHPAGQITFGGIGLTALALLTASSFGWNLGAVTAGSAAFVFAVVSIVDSRAALPVLRGVSWSVLVLVAGLFVLVAGVEQTGVLAALEAATRALTAMPKPLELASAAFATGMGSNLINNLPAGLIAGTAATATRADGALRGAIAIGIDLGPNLSVTGSLATILWLIALRRESIEVSAWAFLRVGIVAMPLALLVAVESLLLTFR